MDWERVWVANNDHILASLEEGSEVELFFAEPETKGATMGSAMHDFAEWLMAVRGLTAKEFVALTTTGDYSRYIDAFAEAWADAATSAAKRETVDAGW